MVCPICGAADVSITYNGKIRDGAPGRMTEMEIPVYRCGACFVIWHNNAEGNEEFYERDSYRESMSETVSLDLFYSKHDVEVLDKLKYTGTAVYRGKLFMDIGCGGGGYADYVRGVARQVVLVEPNMNFASQLREKGYEVFSYAEDALAKYSGKLEMITSYDVIEHVDNPCDFMQKVYNLLTPGGVAYIGTPTETPVLRSLLGAEFDSFVFSVQHPWVLSRKTLELICKQIGIEKYTISCYQRYGLGNLIAWLRERRPCGDKTYDFISPRLDALYKSEMADEKTGDYIILKIEK